LKTYADLASHMSARIELIRRKKNSQQMLKEITQREIQQQQPARVPIKQRAFREIDKSETQEERPLTKRRFNPLITKATDIYVRPIKSLRKLTNIFRLFCTDMRMFMDG
jgi:uncharacterized membrane protein